MMLKGGWMLSDSFKALETKLVFDMRLKHRTPQLYTTFFLYDAGEGGTV